jgi:hypothetical protein
VILVPGSVAHKKHKMLDKQDEILSKIKSLFFNPPRSISSFLSSLLFLEKSLKENPYFLFLLR